MAINTQDILQQAHNIQSVTECEKLPSEHGICDIGVSDLFFHLHAHPNSNTLPEHILGPLQLRSTLHALL